MFTLDLRNPGESIAETWVPVICCTQTEDYSDKVLFDVFRGFNLLFPFHESLKRTFFWSSGLHIESFIANSIALLVLRIEGRSFIKSVFGSEGRSFKRSSSSKTTERIATFVNATMFHKGASDVNVMRCLESEKRGGRDNFSGALGYATIFAKRAPKRNNSLEAARVSDMREPLQKLVKPTDLDALFKKKVAKKSFKTFMRFGGARST